MTSAQTLIIESPCIRNCCLDDDNICVGCGRSLQEITHWSAASPERKQAILAAATQRKRALMLNRLR